MDFPQTNTDASPLRTPEQSNILSVSGTLNTLHPYTELRMPDGRVSADSNCGLDGRGVSMELH